jgi:hypothetical protein
MIIAAAAACMLVAIPVPAKAQAQQPTPAECARAYKSAETEQGLYRQSGVDKLYKDYESVLPHVDNGVTIDFDDRYQQLKKKYPDDFDVQSAFASGTMIHEDLRYQGFTARGQALLTGNPMPIAVSVVTTVRQCDQIHGFTPVMGAVDMDRIISHLKAAVAREDAIKQERFATLDDMACAARFLVVANSTAGAEQQEWQRRTLLMMPKVQAANPGMTDERLMTQVQRGAQEVVSKYGDADGQRRLLEDINYCEDKNGLPLSKRN